MARKKESVTSKKCLAKQGRAVAHADSRNDVPLGTKHSLESLLEETPSNQVDQAWEKLQPVGLEFEELDDTQH